MGEGVASLTVGFGGEEGEVVGELTGGRWGGDMEGLLIEDNCWSSSVSCSIISKVVMLTLGAETRVCEILRFRLGFANLELGFLQESAICRAE